MIDKLKALLTKTQELWSLMQDIISVKGGLYVDLFAVIVALRLLAPLKGFPAMTPAEVTAWSVTITAFAASVIGGPK